MNKTKNIFYAALALLTMPFVSLSQEKPSSVFPLLSKYYDLKNALINSDAAGASKYANEFITLVKTVDVKTLAPNEQSLFQSLKGKLIDDANDVASGKDLVKQRAALQTLSDNMIMLVRTAKPSKRTYVAYCPMKKAYWLSAEPVIKNPYYGNSMLTCGKVTETLN